VTTFLKQITDSIILKALPVTLISFFELPYKKEEIMLPALRIYITHEPERWFFGHKQVLDELQRMRFLSLDPIRRDVWAQEGADFALQEVEPLMQYLFQYPLVVSSARL